jgi:hypothetical protein
MKDQPKPYRPTAAEFHRAYHNATLTKWEVAETIKLLERNGDMHTVQVNAAKLADAVERAPRAREQTDPIVFVVVAIAATLESAWWVVRTAWQHPVMTLCGFAGGCVLTLVLRWF